MGGHGNGELEFSLWRNKIISCKWGKREGIRTEVWKKITLKITLDCATIRVIQDPVLFCKLLLVCNKQFTSTDIEKMVAWCDQWICSLYSILPMNMYDFCNFIPSFPVMIILWTFNYNFIFIKFNKNLGLYFCLFKIPFFLTIHFIVFYFSW